ncbi:MAG TPA: tRNA pseudouridine(55) synthase TruB [Burkholderiales bacterium]|nr:tRNA pseudouridine(55) synthase TruB [Burkholderiales bacterium]
MGRDIDGLLLLDKPLDASSNHALQKARRIFSAAKAGHTGTLDPLASGLLPICFGEATKYSAMMLDADKTYRAVLKLGETTTTGDAEGAIVDRKSVSIEEHQVESVLCEFRGEIRQIPPMHSALKHKGKPLYAYVRAGIEIERAERIVKIHDLVMESFEGDELGLTVRCSKGTYIRVLAEDIGKALGCGAHLKSLVRTGIGPFDLGSASTLGEIAQRDDRDALLLPCDALLSDFPKLVLEEGQALSLMNGRAVENEKDAGLYRLYDERGRFMGLVESDGCGKIRPKRMMSVKALEEETF